MMVEYTMGINLERLVYINAADVEIFWIRAWGHFEKTAFKDV